jgi:hypothetical protein
MASTDAYDYLGMSHFIEEFQNPFTDRPFISEMVENYGTLWKFRDCIVGCRVVTRLDVHVSVRKTSGRVRQPHGRPPDGMPSATPPGERHGGRPPNRSSPARTVAPSAGRGGCRPAGRRPGGRPGGPLRLGRPLGAVLQGPSTQPKLWSPITIDLEVRFKRVIPFLNVQVMLYNMGY